MRATLKFKTGIDVLFMLIQLYTDAIKTEMLCDERSALQEVKLIYLTSVFRN